VAFNGHGHEVLTNLVMTRYRLGAEQLIASHPEIDWQKAGRDGVPFAGARWIDEITK
jgi:hypothetical protein